MVEAVALAGAHRLGRRRAQERVDERGRVVLDQLEPAQLGECAPRPSSPSPRRACPRPGRARPAPGHGARLRRHAGEPPLDRAGERGRHGGADRLGGHGRPPQRARSSRSSSGLPRVAASAPATAASSPPPSSVRTPSAPAGGTDDGRVGRVLERLQQLQLGARLVGAVPTTTAARAPARGGPGSRGSAGSASRPVRVVDDQQQRLLLGQLAASQYRPCNVANARRPRLGRSGAAPITGAASAAAPASQRVTLLGRRGQHGALEQLPHHAERELALELPAGPPAAPRTSKSSLNSRSSAVLPEPAAPSTTTTPPRPARACSRLACRLARSVSRSRSFSSPARTSRPRTSCPGSTRG